MLASESRLSTVFVVGFVGILSLSLCVASEGDGIGILQQADSDFQTQGGSLSRNYRSSGHKTAGTHSSTSLYSQQPSFARILRTGTFSRILRSAPSFSRILRGGSFSRILRSDDLAVQVPDEDDKKFARMLKSQAFSRIFKKSNYPNEELPDMDEVDEDDVEEFPKRANVNDFSRILRSSPSFSRIL